MATGSRRAPVANVVNASIVGKFPIFVVLAVVQLVRGQILYSGWCPEQDAMDYFDKHRYLGVWYENQRYFTLFEAGGRCMTILHEDAGDGHFAVTNSMVDWFGKQITASGFATIIDTKGPVGAKYNLRYYSNPFFAFASKGKEDGNYWVLDTDYDNYAIVWNCNDKLFSNTQFLWILTRERHPYDWVVDRALWEVERRGLDISELKTTDHTGCPPPFDSYLFYDAEAYIFDPPLNPYLVPPVPAFGYDQGFANEITPYYNAWDRTPVHKNDSVLLYSSALNRSSAPHLVDASTYLHYTALPGMYDFNNLTQVQPNLSQSQSSYSEAAVAYDNSKTLNISPQPKTKFPENRNMKIKVAQEELHASPNTPTLLQNGWQVSDYQQILQLRRFQ